jgi:plasmid stability protein
MQAKCYRKRVATLHVRNVPDDLYAALRKRAERENRSINAEAIAILRRALSRRRDADDVLADLRELRHRLRWPEGSPPPEELIRRDRDVR